MGSYTNPAFKSILENLPLKTAFEIGSLHALDAIEILKSYNLEKIIIIECNPECVKLCKKHTEQYSQIQVVDCAAWYENTELSFYKVVESYDMRGNPSHRNEIHDCNIGASSCFKSNGKWPHEKYIQQEIKVKARRLDEVAAELNIKNIDLICMDLQGAELHALKGLGNYLKDVKAIVTELEIEPMYHDQSLYKDVESYLSGYGFKLKAEYRWASTAGDFLFTKE